MKYRLPNSEEIIDIPDHLVRNEREKQVLIYDIKVYGQKPHWAKVAEAIEAEVGYAETPDSVRSIKDRITTRVEREALVKTANNDLLKNIVFKDREITLEDRKAVFTQWMGTQYTSTYKVTLEGPYRKVVVVSDYHGTVHPNIAKWLLENEYDICIHAGDILDQWSVHASRLNGRTLTMQEKETYLDEEIQTMRAWFELLDEKTNAQHIVLHGNHDVRVEQTFIKLLAPILRNDSLMVRMFRTPLELLVEDLANFELGQKEMTWQYPSGMLRQAASSKYLYQLGDALISHMNFVGAQPGTAVNKLWNWLQAYRDVIVGLQDIRFCMQAHTHSFMLDKNCQGGHVYLAETGCALDAPALGYSLIYDGNWTPAAVGLTTFNQFLENGNWKTELESIQLHGVG